MVWIEVTRKVLKEAHGYKPRFRVAPDDKLLINGRAFIRREVLIGLVKDKKIELADIMDFYEREKIRKEM